MAKNYKLSYEVVFYQKLKEVSFHSYRTRPIYIKTIFKRSVKDFKSSSFDIISHPKYARKVKNAKRQLENIIREENEIMEFISGIIGLETTPDELLALYRLYSTDITEILEEAFRAYIVIFFSDLKMYALHRAIANTRSTALYELLSDLRQVLKPDLAKRLFNDSIEKRQVYVPVYEFVAKRKSAGTGQLTLFRWQSEDVQDDFRQFLDSNYKSQKEIIFKAVDKWAMDIQH